MSLKSENAGVSVCFYTLLEYYNLFCRIYLSWKLTQLFLSVYISFGLYYSQWQHLICFYWRSSCFSFCIEQSSAPSASEWFASRLLSGTIHCKNISPVLQILHCPPRSGRLSLKSFYWRVSRAEQKKIVAVLKKNKLFRVDLKWKWFVFFLLKRKTEKM